MSVTLYTPREVAQIRAAAQAGAATLAHVGARLEPGVSTAAIDRWVADDTARRGGRPSQLGYHGFPATVCVSRNHVVCHGIPREDERLAAGDIVNVDITTELRGFHGDTSATFLIGQVDPDARRLVRATEEALAAAIAVVRPGARLGDLAAAIMAVAARERLGVVRDFCGHGIGRRMHEPPQVSHVGRAGVGLRLRPGMVFTIEPMLTLGAPDIEVAADGWTVHTVDRRWSAQFEHTVCVTDDGCDVLTRLDAPAIA